MKNFIFFSAVRSSLRVSLSFLFSMLSYFLFAQNQWQEIGNTHQEGQAAATMSSQTAMTFDNVGTAYIAYYDSLTFNVVVKKQVGNDWVQVGNSVYMGNGAPIRLSIAATSNGNVYVYFRSSYNSLVYKYNGSTWGSISSLPAFGYVAMVADANNNLYLSYYQNSAILMMKYDGTNWSASSTVGTATGSSLIAMGLDSNNNPYVAYGDNLNSYKVTVKKYDGANWITIGSVGFSLYAANGKLDIALDLTNNTPYILYRNTTSGLFVMKYDGANWVNVGSITNTADNDLDLAIDNTGIPYMIKAGGSVTKYNGSSWVAVGYDSPAFANQTYTGLAFSPTTNTPYKIARTLNLDKKVCVYQFNGTFWELVVKAGIGIASPYYNYWADMTIDANGVAYTAYIDAENASKVTVKKYNGSAWVLVGTAGFSAVAAVEVKLAIDGTGTPYIAYSSAVSPNALIIMKYNGTAWVNVGSTIVSANTNIRHIALAIDGNNTPYFAYENGMVYVLKFNGTSWVNVGSSPSTTNNPYYNCLDLAIDSNNIPYIAMIDNPLANSNSAIYVKKYINNSWVNVGNSSVTAILGPAALSIGPNNTPYLAFTGNLGTSYDKKNYVYKFNGNVWTFVGMPDTGPAAFLEALSPDVKVDSYGVPYFIYFETRGPNINRIYKYTHVLKYNGSDWKDLGDFTHYGKNTVLAINNATNTLYAGYAAPEVFMSSYSFSPAALVTSNMDNNIACLNSSITFTASLLSYGAGINATNYQWKKNGTNVGTNSNTLTLIGGTSVNTNDSIYCEISYTGASSGTMLSNKMAMRVLQAQTATVSCYQGAFACAGITLNFSINFNAAYTGINYQYEWYKNSTLLSVGSTVDIYSSSLVTGDSIKCKITSSLPCQSVSTFYATPYIANIGTALSVTISTPNTTVCDNVPITFTATPNAQVNNNTFKWKKNGSIVGTTNVPSYTFPNLYNANNAIITCDYTSTVCSASTATSNAITMSVLPAGSGSLSISVSQNNLCSSNTAVTFTAVPNYSIYVNPSLQWKKNGNIIPGATSTTYTVSGLAGGDIIVCQMITNNNCKPIISSNAITMIISNNAYISVPTIKITNQISNCGIAYTPYTLSTQSTWGGTNPFYQWKKDGVNVGTNSPTYTIIPGTNTIGAVYTCEMTSNAACALQGKIVSQSIVPNYSPSSYFDIHGSLSSGEEAGCPGDTVSYNWSGGFCDCGCYYVDYFANWNGTILSSYTGSQGIESIEYIVGIGELYDASVSLTSCLFGQSTCPDLTLIDGPTIPNTYYSSATLTPTISIASTPYNVCGGDTIIFTATATYAGKNATYQWKVNGVNVVGAVEKQVAFDNLQNGDIVTCALTSSIACTVPNYLVSNAVTFFAPNTLSASPTPTICSGGAATITFNAGAGTSAYTWQQSTNGGASWYSVSGTNSTTTSTVVTLTATRLFRVIYNSTTCGQQIITPVFSMNVVPDPTLTITASNNNFCAGGNTTLTATLNGGVGSGIYQWQQNIGGVYSNIPGATAATYTTPNLTANTTYKMIANQTGAGCNATGTNTFTVTIKPLPSIYTSPASASICVGGSQSFTAYNGTSYSWTPATGLSATTGSPVTATPSITTTYSLTGVGTNGCSKTISVPVTVNQDPSITVTGDTTVCNGGTLTLTSAGAGGAGSCTRQWQTSTNGTIWTNIVGATAATYTTPALTATTYYRVTYTCSASGCSPAATSNAHKIHIFNNTLGTVGSPTLCVGGSVKLLAPVMGGTYSCTWTWESSLNNTTWTAIAGVTTMYYYPPTNAASAIYYRATASCAGASCTGTATPGLLVTVNPDPSATISGQNSICGSGSTVLTAIPTGGAGTHTYQWQENIAGVFSNIAGATNLTYTTPILTAAKTYRMAHAATGSGCGTVNSANYSISILPLPSVYTSPASATICIGGSQSFTAYNGTSYSWSPATGLSATTGSPVTASPSVTTTYSLTGLGANGCSKTISVPVTVNPDPSISISGPSSVPSGTTATLTATTAGGAGTCTRQWQSSTNGSTWTNISGATSITYTTPAIVGTKYYRATYTCTGSGCSPAATSNVKSIVGIQPPTRLAEQGYEMTLFPNPATVNLMVSVSTVAEEKIDFVISDMLGKTLSAWQGKAIDGVYETEISIENLSQGIYFLSAKVGERIMTQKFVKE